MMDYRFETVIIGSGQAGLATAWHLTRRRLPCIILDENDNVGAAWRNRWGGRTMARPYIRLSYCLQGHAMASPYGDNKTFSELLSN